MDSMFNTPQEVVQANMNGAVSFFHGNHGWCLHRAWRTVQ